jgi:tRNA-specific 2-thiouridylase
MFERVFVAMSGGVDSSLTAHLLLEAGYEVEGIHLELTYPSEKYPEASHTDLERTCRILNIPLHYLHTQTEFENNVIEYFCKEYSLGRTPNPCIRCNKNIKFGLLLEKVREMGGNYLATGHYARVEASKEGYRLLKGVDSFKDQSYFLYILSQKELSHILFPIGGLFKSEVKKRAADLGLPAANHAESQDICFLPDGDYKDFVSSRVKPEPGEIVDTSGRVLGKHQGLARYTIGQRQGMGISSKERLYVIGMDSESNRLIIGPQDQLFKSKLTAHNLNWISGTAPSGTVKVTCKIRYRTPEVPAELQVKDQIAGVIFSEPQRAVAPGQSIVFYQGDAVIGGGIIGETA